ncbi:MAG: DUF86 domain-containing protein [Deltaproteobacteria bacterium]|nr:DUF86 domain-containing protein [Deltaproteobacteria bacterium]
MPRRDADLLIEDITAAIRKIEQYTRGQDREAFLGDEKTIDAVVRNLEVIGEAARQMPGEFVISHPEVPWPRIAGLRNRIVHEYFGLDLDIIWEIIETDLPELASRLPLSSVPAA